MRITMTLNSAIWTHPMMVIRKLLEPLGIDQRVDEIDHDHDRRDRAEDVIEQHGCLTFFRKRGRRGWKRRRSRRRSQSSRNRAWGLPQQVSCRPWEFSIRTLTMNAELGGFDAN